MRTCENCGREVAENSRFCPFCDYYLGWDGEAPEASDQSAPPPRAPRESSPEVDPAVRPAGRVTTQDRFGLALTLASPRVEVAPGEAARLAVTVRNLGTTVDEVVIGVEVDGAPRSWVHVEPERVALYPGVEKEVVVAFSPSPDDRLRVGALPFSVTARSQPHPETAAEQDGQVDVARVTGLDLDVLPERQRARRSADYRIAMRNRSNHPLSTEMRVGGSQHLLQWEFTPQRLDIPEFGTATTALRVEAPSKSPDESRPYPFQISAVRDDGDLHGLADAPADVVFIHEPAAPRRWYGATLLGWVVGGVVGAVLLGGLVGLGVWGIDALSGLSEAPQGNSNGNGGNGGGVPSADAFDVGDVVGPGVLAAVAGFGLGSGWGVWRMLRSRQAVRGGPTALLAGVLSVLWAGGVASAVESRSVLGVVLLALANPALIARSAVFLGLPTPFPVHAQVPEPSPLPSARQGVAQEATLPVSSEPAAVGWAGRVRERVLAFRGADARRDPGNPVPASVDTAEEPGGASTGGLPARWGKLPARRSRRTVALAACTAVLLVYLFVGLPGRVSSGVNIRSEPGTSRGPVGSLSRGDVVTVRCVDGSWAAITLPRPGYVSRRFVDHLPARPCLW